MSVNVYNFNEKSGICTIEQRGHEFTLNLYGSGQSNCFLTSIWESKPDEEGRKEYQLQWFFCDEEHGERMLGLRKTFNGTQENCLTEITSLTLYRDRCRQWQKIRNMFRKAFGKDFPITILESEG